MAKPRRMSVDVEYKWTTVDISQPGLCPLSAHLPNSVNVPVSSVGDIFGGLALAAKTEGSLEQLLLSHVRNEVIVGAALVGEQNKVASHLEPRERAGLDFLQRFREIGHVDFPNRAAG